LEAFKQNDPRAALGFGRTFHLRGELAGAARGPRTAGDPAAACRCPGRKRCPSAPACLPVALWGSPRPPEGGRERPAALRHEFAAARGYRCTGRCPKDRAARRSGGGAGRHPPRWL